MRTRTPSTDRQPAEAPYELDAESLLSITDLEVAFGTTRLLPAWDAIPDAFKLHNDYTSIAEAICYGRPLPDLNVTFNAGFEAPSIPSALHKCVLAHLISFDPKHEHKIDGVAYMLSRVFTIISAPSPTR